MTTITEYQLRKQKLTSTGDREMNKQSKVSPKLTKNKKNKQQLNNNVKQEMDYFIAGPGKEACKVACVKPKQEFQKKLAMYCQALGA